MTADEFAEELVKHAPDVASYVERGLTVDEADGMLRRFRCVLRSADVAHSDRPLLDLLERYDVSAVEVGAVSFIAGPREVAAGVQVGELEIDPLVVVESGEGA